MKRRTLISDLVVAAVVVAVAIALPASAQLCDKPFDSATSSFTLRDLEGLFKEEPMLATVFAGSQRSDEQGHSWFDTESYAHGTFVRKDGAAFTHSAIFTERLGEVGFRIEVIDATTGEKVVFTGTVRDAGRHITYHRTEANGERSDHEWSSRNADR